MTATFCLTNFNGESKISVIKNNTRNSKRSLRPNLTSEVKTDFQMLKTKLSPFENLAIIFQLHYFSKTAQCFQLEKYNGKRKCLTS